MLDDLYASENEAIVNDMIARPPQAKPQDAKFSIWKTTTAALRGVAAGAAESAGFASDILGAFGQVAGAYPEVLGGPVTPEQAKQADEQRKKLNTKGIDFSSEGGDVFRGVASNYMPDPTTAHTAEQTVFGLTRFGSKAVGYSLAAGSVPGAALLGLDEGMTTADALKQHGVDEATRTQVGAVAGVAAAAAPLLPVAGKTVAQTVGLVGVGGPGAFMAQQAATRQILQDAGYDHLSTQYDPFDPVGLAVSTLVPAGFGAWAMRGAKVREGAVKAEQARVAEAVKAEQESAQTGPPRPTPEQVDAARVEMLTQHMESSGLFKPEDARAAAMHVEAYAKAMDDLNAGRRVDVTDLVPIERLETAKALDTFAKGLDDARAELMSQAAMRADPGAVRQMQTELADAQVQLSTLEDAGAIKARASELQQADRLSFKQAMTQARKEFALQADDVRARITRLESLIEDNATATQAIDALGKLDQQAEQVKQQRSQIDAPGARPTATAMAAQEATKAPAPGATSKTEPTANAPSSQQERQPQPSTPGAAPLPEAAQPKGADAPGNQPARAGEQGGGGVSSTGGGAAEAGLVAQRLADIQTQFPDLTVQMDGMDKPMALSDFLEQVQREAMEGTDFDLGGNDAPLMQVAATCFLLNG